MAGIKPFSLKDLSHTASLIAVGIERLKDAELVLRLEPASVRGFILHLLGGFLGFFDKNDLDLLPKLPVESHNEKERQ